MEHNNFFTQSTNTETESTKRSVPVGRIIAVFLLYFFLTAILMGILPFIQPSFRYQLFYDQSALPLTAGPIIYIGWILVMNGLKLASFTFAPVFLILLLIHFYLREHNVNYATRNLKLELFSLYLLSLLVSLGIILIFGGSFGILFSMPRFD